MHECGDRWRNRSGWWCWLALVALGCAPAPQTARDDSRLQVVATTGMVADAARAVAGSDAEVVALMGSGVDPHVFKASEGDVRRLAAADLILYNGLHLEGKMADVLEGLARQRPVVAVAEAVPDSLLRHPADFEGQPDPHVWFDLRLWRHAVERTRDALSAADTARAGAYGARAAAFLDTLAALDDWTRSELARVPREQRVLVTAHDAFGYFGAAYDVDVVALQGISTVAEFGLADVRRLVDLIVGRRVRAVFVESSVPRRSIEAVVEGCRARGHEVRIGGTLYSDALGSPGTAEGEFVGMMRANIRTIVEALR